MSYITWLVCGRNLISMRIEMPIGLIIGHTITLFLVLTIGVVCLWIATHVLKANREVQQTYEALAVLIQHSHPQTQKHLARVAHTAQELARELRLSKRRAILVGQAALLHDIGKIAIDERILDKPSKLNEEEFRVVRNHPEYGASILDSLANAKMVAQWIHLHHERIDGLGYPLGLGGESIPIEARIISVVDAFDAMTGLDGNEASRTYRNPISAEDALAELQRCQGTQFCPLVVSKFAKILAQEERE